MSRRRHKKKPPEEVQLNLAAMLDMAFQLLAFFILTFRPTPIEGHFQMHLPLAVPMTNVEMSPDSSTGGGGGSAFVETLDIMVPGDENGQATSVTVGRQAVVLGRLTPSSLQQLDRHLRSIFGLQAIPFDRIQIHADKRLHYEELLKIVDICMKQKMPDGKPMRQISFVEMGGTE